MHTSCEREEGTGKYHLHSELIDTAVTTDEHTRSGLKVGHFTTKHDQHSISQYIIRIGQVLATLMTFITFTTYERNIKRIIRLRQSNAHFHRALKNIPDALQLNRASAAENRAELMALFNFI